MTEIRLTMRSRCLATKAQVCMLLPTNQGTGKHKVLWLLHGATGDYEDFLIKDNITRLLGGSDTIVVMPSALNSDYANHGEFANGFMYTDFFFEELMPYIFATFPASEAREDNYIAGYSMGGAGALLLGLFKPDRFKAIAPLGSSMRESEFLKPFMDMTGAQFRAYAEEHRTSLPTEFGDPRFGITTKEINMIARYPYVRDYVNSEELTWDRFGEVCAAGNCPEMFFCCGDRDGCFDAVRRFLDHAGELGAENITAEFIPGKGHECEKDTVAAMLRHFGL